MSRDTRRQSAPPPAGASALPTTEEWVQACAEVTRLWRELAEAMARKDALVARHFGAGVPLPEPPAPPVIVVGSVADFLVRQLKSKGLREPFNRADMRDVAGVSHRTLSNRIRLAVERGLLRRLGKDRYVFPGWQRGSGKR